MSFEITRQLLSNAIAAMDPGFPVGWEGSVSLQPEGFPTWGRWNILQGDTIPAIIGPGHTRGVGMVILQVFVKEEGGTKAFTEAADKVAGLLDRLELSREKDGVLHCVTLATSGMIQAGSAGGYQQKNIVCEFRRDTYGFAASVPPPADAAVWEDGTEAQWEDGTTIEYAT